MAVQTYLGDRVICDFESDTKPTNIMDGAFLTVLSSRLNYIKRSGVWNVCESSGNLPLFSGGASGQTLVFKDGQWSGSYNLYNDNNVIGFGFSSTSPLPLNKGHFYSNYGGVGWATGIILESQSNSGVSSNDYGDLTTMTISGDYGDLTAMSVSGDWGDLSVSEPTVPGISIDVKLSDDRRTVSALRFRRLTSGVENYDSAIEFWVTDSGTLNPKFWIQSGNFLPYQSGRMFLGDPALPFSGIHSLKAILKQLQFDDSVIPSSGNTLSSNSGQLYWSGSKVAILSGVTENGVITYNEDYPNSFVQTGVVVVNNTLGVGINTAPSYNLHIKGSNPSLGIEAVNTIAELDFVNITNAVTQRSFIVASGTKFDIRVGSTTIPTLTIMTGAPGQVGIRTAEPRSDLELLRNSVGSTPNNNFGLFIRNDTAATSSSNEYSPPLNFRGSFWNPTGLDSMTSDFRSYVSTASGANPLTSGSGALVFEGQLNGSGYKELIRLDYDAGLKLASNRTFNSGVVFADHRGGLMEASGMCFDTGNNVLKIKTIGGNQARYHVGGTLYANNDGAVSSETNNLVPLQYYVLPANTFNGNGDRIEIYAAGSFGVQTSNFYTGSKRLMYSVAGTKIFNLDNVPSGNFNSWIVKSTFSNQTVATDSLCDYFLYTGGTYLDINGTINSAQIASMGVASIPGYRTNDNLIAFSGAGSGVFQTNMFVTFYPGNPGAV